MAPHTSGAGATVSGTSYSAPTGPASKERYVYGILGLLEQEENRLSRVAVDRTDKISITANLSTKKANIDLLINTTASNTANGVSQYAATHYLVGSTFTSGTGGSSLAPNLAQAAMEAVIALKLLELDLAKNPDKITAVTRCQHVLNNSGGTNATFSASLEFPIEIIILPGGGSVIEGKTYLT
ncbi:MULTISPECIES: hypothetical protein [unclassified Microcoleus]|uniref:hypothetical protein n=1 Tax=unclassified Microcoleus TaxID=2642155 RepID=UPI0025E77EC9|nr:MULTISPECIES: hypothetical protein [unclassified Microcoleus]